MIQKKMFRTEPKEATNSFDFNQYTYFSINDGVPIVGILSDEEILTSQLNVAIPKKEVPLEEIPIL